VPPGPGPDDPYDPDTLVWTRTQPVQPPGRTGWGQADGPDRGPGDQGRPGQEPQPDPSPEDEPDESASAPAGKKRKHFWRELLIIVVVAAALTLLVKAFVVQVYRIPSASMENTLQIGDRVLVNKLVYNFRGIARGDIIVFSGQDSWGPDAPPPSGNGFVRVWDDVLSDVGLQSSQTYYIKRVIGLPGDRVACCTNGKVTVNGVALTETSYLYPGDAPSSFPFKAVTVPPGHLWVMGDHRGDSDDSRYHTSDPGGGAIPENEVVGRAFLIIWPPSQLRDLPIPSTFSQAALHAGPAGAAVLGAQDVGGTALAAVAAVPVAGAAAGAGVLGAPVLLLRRRRSRLAPGNNANPPVDMRIALLIRVLSRAIRIGPARRCRSCAQVMALSSLGDGEGRRGVWV
jgi:signal peptidase I